MLTENDFQKDFGPFIDPATDLKISEGSHGIRLQFIRNAQDHDYFFSHSDKTLVARHQNNKKFASIRSLLASAEFADIKNLIATQKRMFLDFDPDQMLPPEGTIDFNTMGQKNLLRALTPATIGENAPAELRIILLDGPAGVGKTSLIQRTLIQRARSPYDSSSLPPILHVTSRGRRLSGLDESLAQSLQLIRAKFTFDQVPVLVRTGLIQLAIDGFDELVDPEGYKDAWYALKGFLAEVAFGGPIILAGRDTFFDQQSFAKQMQEFENVTINHIKLTTISPPAAKIWLGLRGWKQSDIESSFADSVLIAGSYTLRPFFLTELGKTSGFESSEFKDQTPRAFLVNKFIEREAKLISEQLGMEPSQIENRLTSIFEETALEMADNETDAVDLSFLQLVTEMTFSEILEAKDVAKLRHKAGSFALLEQDAREGHRRFPHTEISHHFLAQSIIKLICRNVPIRFLRRGIVSSDFLTVFSEKLLSLPESEVGQLIQCLERTLASEQTFDRLPENSASLLLATLPKTVGQEKRRYVDFQLANGVLFGLISPAELVRLRVQWLDVREAEFSQVEFSDCVVVNLIVDETTQFGITSPDVHHLHVQDKTGKLTEIFDPNEIANWISAHSAKAGTEQTENTEALRLFERVCRIMLRQHMIKDHDSDEFGRFLKAKYWHEIEQILFKAGMVARLERRQMAGVQAPFVRISDPYKILALRSSGKYAKLWAQIAAIKT